MLSDMYDKMERWIAPDLRYSQSVYEEVLYQTVGPGIRWLDVGCGHRILPEWRGKSEDELVSRAGSITGVDPDSSAIQKHRSIRDVRTGFAESLPFADCSFDLVTANMVVEHMTQPDKCMAEIFRVLAPGGRFILHTPSVYGHATILARFLPDAAKRWGAKLLDGRDSSDVYPAHYKMNSAREIARMAEKHGFELAQVLRIPTNAIFRLITPLAFFELLWVRWTMTSSGAFFRTNIIATLRRPAQ